MNNHLSAELAQSLLRHFEPVLRFTRGEKFFPIDVGPYVLECSLWERAPGKPAACLIPSPELTLERLGRPYAGRPGAVNFLKFVEPLTVAELAALQLQKITATADERDVFRAGRGRLARVGYVSRFADALFSFVLLTRGRVPGTTAAAAAEAYRRLLAARPSYSYHGRVIRQGDWLVLQYWFFYAFNNWRSGFFGANDHEADWEMVCVYLSDAALTAPPGAVKPEWVAYASHDYEGADLRRAWGEPEVEKVGEHPVVYVGAGSHASYFVAGEYMTELPLPFLAPLVRVAERLQSFWWRRLRQHGDEDQAAEEPRLSNMFRIPFIDYARGDGRAIGPGQEQEWGPPRLLDPPPAWAVNYKGLWGLFTGDPFAGEDAPAGAMYNRDGSPRRVWYDPVGWGGLEAVPPADRALASVLARQALVRERITERQAEAAAKGEQLRGLGVEAAAQRAQSDVPQSYERLLRRIGELGEEARQLRAEVAADEALLRALADYEGQLRGGGGLVLGERPRRPHRPASDVELRTNRLAEVWSAASIGLMLIGVVALTLFARQYLVVALVTVLYVVALIEAWFRKRFIRFVANIAVGLALVATAILLYEFFWPAVTVLVLLGGGYILWENLRELWT